ncbi:hypothetical protein [Peptacetobacter sp. AB800]|uniref:hypothetical protein n=1 Tax=Peptacetobacter sp. AB800 TaxID=3388428 RepID=UPI0039FD6754
MDIIRDKIESLIAYMIVAGGLFIAGVFLYFILALLIEAIGIILYILYLTIGCMFYKIGYAILF